MIKLILTALFVLSVSISAGTILISYQLRKAFKANFFSTLMYMLVFFFAFGFYAIWGQIIISAFISPFVSTALLHRITDVALLLGSPFLVLAWFMLLRLALELSGKTVSNTFVLWFLFINMLLVVGVGYSLTIFPAVSIFLVIKYYFICLSICYTVIAATLLLNGKRQAGFIDYAARKELSAGLVAVAVIQNGVLILYNGANSYVAFLFIFLFFAGNAFSCLYLKYKPDYSKLLPVEAGSLSMEEFCKRYEISPRETDIVRQLCNGLTNQQIADKLFISLQTVKDHTSRIYSKTNTSNRVQLIKLVQGGEK